MKKNYGFFISLFLLTIYFVCLILFCLKYYSSLKNGVERIVDGKKKVFIGIISNNKIKKNNNNKNKDLGMKKNKIIKINKIKDSFMSNKSIKLKKNKINFPPIKNKTKNLKNKSNKQKKRKNKSVNKNKENIKNNNLFFSENLKNAFLYKRILMIMN